MKQTHGKQSNESDKNEKGRFGKELNDGLFRMMHGIY